MTGAELVYFEADSNGTLTEIDRKEMRNDVCSLALSPLPEGRKRAKVFIAILSSGSFVSFSNLVFQNRMLVPISTLSLPAC
jgi:hypothetical protein